MYVYIQTCKNLIHTSVQTVAIVHLSLAHSILRLFQLKLIQKDMETDGYSSVQVCNNRSWEAEQET